MAAHALRVMTELADGLDGIPDLRNAARVPGLYGLDLRALQAAPDPVPSAALAGCGERELVAAVPDSDLPGDPRAERMPAASADDFVVVALRRIGQASQIVTRESPVAVQIRLSPLDYRRRGAEYPSRQDERRSCLGRSLIC
jgi:hypothetical protein